MALAQDEKPVGQQPIDFEALGLEPVGEEELFGGKIETAVAEAPEPAPTSTGELDYAALGLEPIAEKEMFGFEMPKKEPQKTSDWDTLRGLEVSMRQFPQLAYGVAGLVGATSEQITGYGEALRDWGFRGYKDWEQSIEPVAKETDDVTVAWQRAKEGDVGALVDWAQYGIGYALGQLGETAAVSALGALAGGAAAAPAGPAAVPAAAGGAVLAAAGKTGFKALATNLVEKAIAKQALKIAEEQATKQGVKLTAEQLAKQAESQAVKKLAGKEIGSNAAIFANSIGMELGGIYGEAESQAKAEGRELTGVDLARIWGTGLAAGGLEGLTDKIGLDLLKGKLSAKLPAGRLAGAAVAGGIGILGEGLTETAQTALERAGAGKDVISDDAVNEYINAASLGALGGGVIGGAGGFISGNPKENAAAKAKISAEVSKTIAPETANEVAKQADAVIQEVAQETPDQRVARLQQEAKAASGITLEEEAATLPAKPEVAPTPEIAQAAQARITEREGKAATPVETPTGTRIEAAAYQAPDGTVYYGASHLDAMAKARDAGKIDQAAIDAKQEVASRETPEFGFATNSDPFVSRDQAEAVARESGQITVEQPATGKLHSNEVSLDAFAQPVTPEAAPAAVEPTQVTPPVTPELEPLRRVVKAEQTEEDVAGLVDGGLVELYKGQPVLTQAGLDALPEAERPRLTPEARKIQIDTRTSEAAAEAISKNLRIGVDQVPVDVRMPEGWTLEGDVYVPPTVETAPAPATLEPKIEVDLRSQVVSGFEARSKQHKEFSEGLNKAVAANSLTEDGAILLREVFKDADPKLLGRATISINSRRRYLGFAFDRGGTELSDRAIKKALDGRFGKNMTPEVMAMVVTHEIGHHGYNSLLTKDERSLIKSIFTKMGEKGRRDFFSRGAIPKPIQVKYHAKSQQEFFAQSFAEYVFSDRLPDPEIKPIFDRIIQKLKQAFQTLMNRNANIEQLVPLYEKLLGEAPTPEVRESRREGGSTLRITADDARELQYKIGTLLENADLQSDYGITREQAKQIYNSIPADGGNWSVPAWANQAVRGELEDQAKVLRDMADDARGENRTGEALRMNRQANRFKQLSEGVSVVRESRMAITPQQDRDYLDAVERGDLDAASRVVEDAATKAGFTQKWFHGTAAKAFNVFRDFGRNFIYFTQDRGDAMDWAKNNIEYARPEYAQGETPTPRVVEAFINADNIFNRTNEEHMNRVVDLMSKSDDRSVKNQTPQQLRESLLEENYEWYEEVAYKFIRQAGFDGAYIFESQDFDPYNLEEADLGILNPNLIKSADPVTYDDQGNIIPLSQRFQPEQADIRYRRRVKMGRAGMETSAVEARLQELGFPTGGIIRVVNQPDADFEGRTIILDGKVTGIELNAAALKDNAAIDRVLNHEFAESANADGALNRLVERLTPKEKKEINDTITRLRYEERARTTEEAARAIETLAEAWKGRGFFTRAVARVEAWASKLGFKLTRRAAEYIAARNLADINTGFRAAYNRFINVKGEAREGRAFVTPEENAWFLELAKDPEANREELQKMVDEAAKKAGFSVFDWWHGTKKDFNTFKATRYDDGLIFFSSKRDFSERWAKNRKPDEKILERIESVKKEARKLVDSLFAADPRFDIKKPWSENTPEMNEAANKYLEAGKEFERSKLDGMTWIEAEREMGVRIIRAYLSADRIFDPSKDWREVLPAILNRLGVKSEAEIDKQSMDMLLKGNYLIWEDKKLTDAVFEKFDAMMIQEDSDGPMNTIAVRDPSLIKMADPVTYDDQGNVIPLEQRFQPTTPDIRYARRDYQTDADSYKINDLSKIRELLNLSNIEDGIVKFLSRDLLDAKWAKIPVANDATTHGHCWVAAEAAYHILGGKEKDWEHRTLNNKGWPEGLDAGETHHFIQNKKTGEIIDPTRSQFGNVTIPYENSIFGGAFMGKTAESPSIRAKALLHRIAAGETRTEVRESRREPEAIPTFTEGTPEAATLKEMEASMAKVDAASEAKGGKPETYKISEIASVWMDSGLDERALQDAIVEYTNLTPANAKRVASAIARQYDIQQSIATAFLETQTGLSVEALPEGVTLPKEVDPDRPRPVMQRLFEVFMGVKVPPKKITGSEKAFLRSQILLKIAANRAAKNAQKATADAVVKTIKSMGLYGEVRPKQVAALAKRAAKVIWTSEKSVEVFNDYAAKVVANANYDADLREAKDAQKRAKQLSKQKNVAMSPQRQVLDNISRVAVNRLDDPRMFADVVNYYMRAFKSAVSPDYVVMPDSELTSYLSQMESEATTNQTEIDRVANERLAAKYGVSVDEVNKLVEADNIIAELKKIEKREEMENLLTEKAIETQLGLSGYDTSLLRADQKPLVEALLKVDPSKLDAKEKQKLIRIANNVIYNDQTNGAQVFVAIANGQQNARQAAQDSAMVKKNRAWIDILPTLGSKTAEKTFRNWALELQSVADTFRNIFGKESMAKMFRLMGLYDLDRGFTDSNNVLDKIQEAMAEFYKKNVKKYGKAARDQDGILSEGIVGFLIQRVPAKGESESIAQRRDLIKQDIANRRNSQESDRIAMADRIEKILNEIDGNTIEEILNNLKQKYRPNYDSVMYLMNDLLPQYKEFLQRFDENFNDQANNYDNPYYLPIDFINAGPTLEITPESEALFYENVSLRPKQAANTIKRVDYTKLPLDKSNKPKEIQFNLRKGTYDSLSEQINAAYTSEAWQKIFSFMKTPEAQIALGGGANRDFMVERLNRLRISRMRRGSMNNGAMAKFADSLSTISRKLGVGIALGGVYQVFKQSPDQLISAIGTTGRPDLLSESITTIGKAKSILNKFSIGRRGDASAGYKYINQMEGAQNRLERAFTESRWSEVKENASKVADVWMVALKKTDFACAAAAWMTYYRADLDKKGIKFEGWDREAQLVDTDPTRQDAASYAENMTDIYQGSSDPTKMATFAQSGKSGWENLFKAIFVPFNSFAVQQRMRIYSDARDAFTQSGEAGKAGAAGLTATVGGMLAFHTVRRLMLPVLTGAGATALYALLGVDMDEPDEEKQKEEANKLWRQFQGEVIANMLVGGAPQFVEAQLIDAVNYSNYLVSLQLESDDVIDDKGEIMSFDKYQKERSPLWRYRSFDNAMTLGMLDIGLGQAEKAAMQTKMLATPEEMEKYTPEEQRLLWFSALSEWMYLMRLNDADFARMVTKARKDMIAAVEDREKRIRAIRSGR